MNIYTSQDICVLTPTKDRPHKIENLLESLVNQTEKVGRIIIIVSGQNIESIIEPYLPRLPIEYYYSEIAGQIRQRKLGISKLDNQTKLVATLDDDIILDNDSISNLLKYWNSKDENTVGIGFNITNMSKHEYSKIKEFFFLSSIQPGQVLSSGYPTSIVNVDQSIPTKWLNGGATVWKQEELIEGIHKKTIDSSWAPCEDLMFSYPIGKIKSLWVCKDAKVFHDDNVKYHSIDSAIERGRTLSKWTLDFVIQNPELNRFHFYISTISSSVFNMMRKVFTMNFFFELGRISYLVNKK